MATFKGHLFFALVLSLICSSKAYIQCGNFLCLGSGAYCCGDHCCYHAWSYWWFWCAWIVGILLIVSCCFSCRRRRRIATSGNPDYIIVPNGSAATYGAIEGPVGHTVSPAYTWPPQSPPGYHSVTQKPPSYMEVAGQNGGQTLVAQAQQFGQPGVHNYGYPNAQQYGQQYGQQTGQPYGQQIGQAAVTQNRQQGEQTTSSENVAS